MLNVSSSNFSSLTNGLNIISQKVSITLSKLPLTVYLSSNEEKVNEFIKALPHLDDATL